ncbi:MAG: transketolase [Verrucomicrobia bacterium GWC2_42_7]|nr:MAG: transketolase [Verrucomicrobia bacterium GWC2_42_7]
MINSTEFARRMRVHILDMIYSAKASHIGSALSCTDIVAVLYNNILKIESDDPHRFKNRDRIVFSKGHASASLYAALALAGFFPEEELATFYKNGSKLSGHVSHKVPGVEFSTGSLGHGLSVAVGMALAAKKRGEAWRSFAILSDGECDEGSTWEAALFANQFKLDNLLLIIDYNKIQSLDYTKMVLDLEPFEAKWKSFGWESISVDGHNHKELHRALSSCPINKGSPSVIIAHTVKGKGISFMEDKVLWHYRCPDEEEYKRAVQELKGV